MGNAKMLPVICLLPLLTSAVAAAERHDHGHRHHGAHVHGIGTLNLALEGRELHLELSSPAANIVGFEHAPASAADRAALNAAVARLREADRLFGFDAGAGCRMKEASVDSPLIEAEHEGHAHEHEHEHSRGDRNDHAEAHAAHSDIEAVYRFECAEPDRVSRLTIGLFADFPGTEKLDVQYVIGNRQGAAEATAADPDVIF